VFHRRTVNTAAAYMAKRIRYPIMFRRLQFQPCFVPCRLIAWTALTIGSAFGCGTEEPNDPHVSLEAHLQAAAADAQDRPHSAETTPESIAGSEQAELNPVRSEAVAALRDAGADVTLNTGGEVVVVNLMGRSIDDDTLRHISGMGHLQLLNLEGTPITDRGLLHLTGLHSLRRLRLNRTKVTSEGMRHLKRLSSLEQLFLVNTDVDNQGLQELKALKRLKRLRLADTQVTVAAMEAFIEALPDCSIHTLNLLGLGNAKP